MAANNSTRGSNAGYGYPLADKNKGDSEMDLVDDAANELDVELDTVDDKGAGDDKGAEIDYTKLDPAKIPHDVVSQTTPFSGLLSETQQLRQANQTLQLQINEHKAAESRDNEDQGDPDEFISRAELDRRLEAQAQKIAKQNNEKNAQALERDQNKATARFLQEHRDNDDLGLDANLVLRQTITYLKEHDPEMLDVMSRKVDAAKALYNYGVAAVPELREKADSFRHEKFLASLKSGGGSRDRGYSAATAKAANQLLATIEMPDEEILKQIELEELGGG